MKKIILVALISIMSLGAFAQEKEENCINVTGRSERKIIPNEIYISIMIDETNSKRSNPVEIKEKEMIAALKSLGIDVEKDLQVEQMVNNPKEYLLMRDKIKTTKRYTLKVGTADMVAQVFESLTKIDISNMGINKISNSYIEQIKNEMRIEAVKNAQEIAQSLAVALGQTIGKAIKIDDYNSSRSFGMSTKAVYTGSVAAMKGASTDKVNLEFEEQKQTYTVTVRFILN